MDLDMNLYEMSPKIYDKYTTITIEKEAFKAVFKEVKKEYKKHKKLEILDLCCGTGIFPRLFLKKLKNIKYVGVDINKEFINWGKSKLKNKDYSFFIKDAITYKSNKKSDIILMTSAYHHIIDNNKVPFLNTAKKHLKSGGKIIFYEKVVAPWKNLQEQIQSGTEFYKERIYHLLAKEKVSNTILFALYDEMYLTAIRKEEQKVDYNYILSDFKKAGMKVEFEKRIWPRTNVFANNKVGDFLFVLTI